MKVLFERKFSHSVIVKRKIVDGIKPSLVMQTPSGILLKCFFSQTKVNLLHGIIIFISFFKLSFS